MMPSDPEQPISRWLEQVKEGDDQALEQLWHVYFLQLVRLARKQFSTAPRSVSDEDDVVQHAMLSFYVRARNGQFPHLNDREGLWKLLISITLNKVRAVVRKERNRQELWQREMSGVHFREGTPSPEFAAEFSDRFQYLLDRLDDNLLRRVAVAKLDGYSNQEIAEQNGKSVPTIERKLRLIREIWISEI